jgi:hypothetical protein
MSGSDTVLTRPLELALTFYTTVRAGVVRLSDGGGPFGFDVTKALWFDHLIQKYGCDGIVETGTFLGDTADYLARAYPDLAVRTCELNENYAEIARRRLSRHPNVVLSVGDSAELLPSLLEGLMRPIVYLDAHWYSRWPLVSELSFLRESVVCVDDFDIGHPRFGYDIYDGVECGPRLISRAFPDLEELYVGNPCHDYPLPCLQTGRRSGTAVLAPPRHRWILTSSTMFTVIPLRPRVEFPDWPSVRRGEHPAAVTVCR